MRSKQQGTRAMAALGAYTMVMLGLAGTLWVAGTSFVAPSKIVISLWTVALPFPAVLFSLAGAVVARRKARKQA